MQIVMDKFGPQVALCTTRLNQLIVIKESTMTFAQTDIHMLVLGYVIIHTFGRLSSSDREFLH